MSCSQLSMKIKYKKKVKTGFSQEIVNLIVLLISVDIDLIWKQNLA